MEGYKQSKSNLFAVPAREGYLVFVTSENQIREVENSPIDQLSFHQAMEDHAGWKSINSLHFAEEISLRVNCKVIFGDRLTQNKDFLQATRDYHRQALAAMLTSHYLPHWTHKYVAPGILALGGAMKKLERFLTLEVKQRVQDMQAGKEGIPKDAITWVIEASTTKDQKAIRRVVQQVISIFFASAHQLPVLLMFSVYRLCEHPEYTKPLIDEVEAMMKLPATDHYKSLPLMESFLREAARHDPLDSLSVQRKVLKDFSFADGSRVPAGNVICVPQQAIMRDPKHYDRPDDFLPFRFADEHRDQDDAVQKFTDVKPHFYLWGAPAKPW
ncbi:MAG: hypothetical protein LQ350_003554 [Teloschistes chrysophthalmus]|nr:MAG: hypothetical protein LQ350_003554 [Niorma chrysophthalma]